VATKGVFHTPAEHTVDYKRHAIEFQIYFEPWYSNPDRVKVTSGNSNLGKLSDTDKVAEPKKGSLNYVEKRAAIGIFFEVKDCEAEANGKAAKL
jgi:hypothetical protein